jgi:hypothetical protein
LNFNLFQDGVKSADEAPDTSYYQWVSFVLLIQAGSFILPHKIWKFLEGGLISSFGKDARAAVMLPDDSKYDEDGVVMEAVVEKYVLYFKSILHHNNRYFATFFLCEMANVALLFLNFYATDVFLNGNFLYYGWNVARFMQMPFEERLLNLNPFCQAFPTEVSCTVPNVGAGGGTQDSNGLCILSQNIINEKLYLLIWFWMVILIFISVPWVIFRVCTLCFNYFRFVLVMSRTGLASGKELRKSVQFVLSKCFLGDWFVLAQIGKNVNTYFYRSFLKELCNELRDKPKRSRSLDKSPATVKLPQLPNHMPSSAKPSAAQTAKKHEAAAAALESKLDSNV